MKKLFLCAVLLLFAHVLVAQNFIPRYQLKLGFKKGYVVLNNGEKVYGKVLAMNGPSMSALTKITLKDGEGTKRKFSVDDVKAFYMEASLADKRATYEAATATSLLRSFKGNFKEVLNIDYFIWERTMDHKGKVRLLQLVNKGYDGRIKVYIDNNSQQNGGQGGSLLAKAINASIQETSYLVLKDGDEQAVRVKKSQYAKIFDDLFGDCEALLKLIENKKKPKWKFFDQHVFGYEQLCN